MECSDIRGGRAAFLSMRGSEISSTAIMTQMKRSSNSSCNTVYGSGRKAIDLSVPLCRPADCIGCMPVAQKDGQLSACDMAEMLQYLPLLDNPALGGLWASNRYCEIVEEPAT